jgi:aminopeptidase N
MDLYFKRHDGQAVTCDDFLAAMADANGADLSVLQRWYSQAGTPRVEVETRYDAGGLFALLCCSARRQQHLPYLHATTHLHPDLLPHTCDSPPTPCLITTVHAGSQTYTIKAKQSTPATPGQPNKLPVLIPITVGLLGPDGGCRAPAAGLLYVGDMQQRRAAWSLQ